MLTDLILILVLVIVNAFFAAAEIALVSARRVRLRQLADDGHRAARVVLRLVETPARFLSTIQIGITLAGFFASAVGALSLVAALTSVLSSLAFLPPAWAGGLAVVIVTIAISFISLIFGELVPKTLAVQAADTVALRVAQPVLWLSRLAAPIVSLLTGTTNLILRLVGSQRRAQFPSVSEDELLAMVETGKDEGVIEESAASMTEGVFGLSDRRARELMVPRVDLAALPADGTIADARQLFLSRGHSRMPVYDGDLDHVVGVLHMKDLLSVIGSDFDGRPIAPLVRPPLYVPEGQTADTLLRQLQRERRHLAIVIDEHGGTAGIITLEDLLEEIVGEIADEYDPDAHEPLTHVASDEVVVTGGLPVADLNDALDLRLSEPGIDTVGGLVTARLSRFARVGDTVDLGEASAEVLAIDRNRIRRVRVTRTAPRATWEAEPL
ncbi:MAG: HlyC/CorC family transporter [Chloroflexi bacterium]|nr:HlyC/CorC family transporter [Chloroflexota bacterium]